MRYKLILLIFVMLIFYTFSVEAVFQCGIANEDVIFNGFMDNVCNQDNVTDTLGSPGNAPDYEPFNGPGTIKTTMGGGSCRFANNEDVAHNESKIMNTINFTHIIVVNVSGTAINLWDRRNPAATTNSIKCGFNDANLRCLYFDAEDNVLNVNPAIKSILNKGHSNMIVTRVNQTSGTLTMEVFVNETFKAGGSISSAVSVIKNNLSIGTDNSGGEGVGWVGNINDNFMINKSISDSQISCIYNGLNNGTLFTEILAPPDTTPPEITLGNLTSEGGLGYAINLSDPFCHSLTNCVLPRTNDTTPSFFFKTNEASTCAVIDRNNNLDQDAIVAGSSVCSTTGTTRHICTLDTANATGRFGLHNFSVGCEDTAGNDNNSATLFYTVNITNNIPPKVDPKKPDNNAFFSIGVNNTDIKFNWTASSFSDKNFSCNGLIDGSQVYTNASYLNATEGLFTSTVSTIGSHTWNVTCTDRFNNINSSQRNFQIKDVDINITLNGPLNKTLIYSATNIQFNFTANFTDTIDKCFLFINDTVNRTNESPYHFNTIIYFKWN